MITSREEAFRESCFICFSCFVSLLCIHIGMSVSLLLGMVPCNAACDYGTPLTFHFLNLLDTTATEDN